MRILFLTPQLPYPPHQGTAMRNCGLIQGLAERHQVSLLSFAERRQSGADSSAAQEVPGQLLAICQRVETVPMPPPRHLVRRALDTLVRPLPDMALRLAWPAFAERLAAWLAREEFDVVHVEGIEMAPYLGLLLGNRHGTQARERMGPRGGATRKHEPETRPPLVVFDDHNCEYQLQKSYAQIDARIPRRWMGALYSLIQWQKLRRYEANVCRRAHHVLAVSRTDADALQRLVPGLQVTVIPNGIDCASYEPMRQDGVPDPGMSRSPSLVFTGKMDFRPNVDAVSWFAETIWPRVRAEVPQAHFYAVGQRPHPKLEPLRADPSLTLTGWVEEVAPFIANATVYVAPLRMGSGTRLKLLEAMTLGKAIVSTRLGAEGLADAALQHRREMAQPGEGPSGSAANDRELVVVDDNDPMAFAEAIIALLRDPARRARLGAAGVSFVEQHFDWRVIIPRLEALYAQRGRSL